MNPRVLIVGGGLSGICLAHQLENRAIDFVMIDQGKNQSSAIAAGMINPMVFRKMVKTWRGDKLIPYLNSFYVELENKTEQRFFFPRKIRRVFSTEDEHNYWEERLKDSNYDDYIHNFQDANPTPEYVINKNGNGLVKSPGYIDAKRFMKANQDYFQENDKLKLENFDYQSFDPERKSYRGESFTHVVFAEGYRGKFNPYFNYLPLQQTKGEVLTVASDELRRDEILNRKCFVLPIENGDFRLGATFSWDKTDTKPTHAAREELLGQYKQLSSARLTILGQEGGIRPTVVDRRPLIGEHPEHQGLYIFNGMGTKGYMIAPYFSEHLLMHALEGATLDDEVNIQRFYKKYFLGKQLSKRS
jgi:glycine/D-amino acid oxidase-like deaminating enzyme